MTLEKVLILCRHGIISFFQMFENCSISINGDISISLSEVMVAGLIVAFIIGIISAFSFRN